MNSELWDYDVFRKPLSVKYNSAFIVGIVVVLVSLVSAFTLKETFENDANFVEK
jgi:hypothetical protein